MKKEIPKAYNPKEVEDKIYKTWEKSGFFNPDNLPKENIKKDKNNKELTYTIVLPPPNITSKLHLGHAAMLAIEDLLVRYHRMGGYRTLWLPGTDHAAIATQNVVEKKLLKEKGLTRHDLGREKFLKKVWEYLKETQAVILNQTRKMGASLDWSREAFTLDKQREKAVRKMFVDMYKAGVIYRGERIVNWCPRCQSTLADDEIEYKEQKTKLYTFKYSKDFPFTIATTRPETKLGDTAVAVNPKDKRYKKYIGKIYEVDFCGVKLKLKIIADHHVEMDFGTGALGVTPAHSMTDWQIAEENDLEIIKVIDENGKIRDDFGEYSGKNVIEAREMIIKNLRKNGLLEKEEEIENNLSLCYRCNTAIEPLPSKQWFINVDKKLDFLDNKSLKEKTIEAAKDKSIKFIPDRFEKRYLDWMENLHDWCISRQIWFGHQIPVWYRDESGIRNLELGIKNLRNKEEIYVGIKPPEEKTNFVFLHTYKASANDDFWPWLKGEISNHNVFLPNLPNPSKPNLKEQMDYISKNTEINENTVIVSHSLGTVLALKLIVEKNLKIKKLILVVPPLQAKKFVDGQKRPPLEKYCDWKFDFEKVKSLVQNIVVFRDTYDPVVFADEPKKVAEKLNAKLIEIKAPETHFNCKECKEILDEIQDTIWTQDPDSLDTWFSSGMWTFSTLGWPDNFKDGKKTGDLAKFHPTQVLETGYEILTLWVSRMVIMSFFALREIPFENVYLHGMILDKHGKKMSKSKGNGIDPIDVINKFGTDAVRLSLLIGSTPGNDTRIFEEKIEGQRNFVNKLWNISRYILMSVNDMNVDTKNIKPKTLADKWILEHLENLKRHTTNSLKTYRFSFAFESDCGIRDFMWDKFADWYLEVSKVQEKNDAILIYVLENLLKLCHPFIPFVTEQIWQEMGKEKLLIIEKWPEFEGKMDEISLTQINVDFELLMGIITEIRRIKNENGISLKEKVNVIINSETRKDLTQTDFGIIKENRNVIESLAGVKNLKFKMGAEKSDGWIQFEARVIGFVNVGDLIDIEKEIEKIKKEIANLKKYLSQIENKLKNKKFVANAPDEIVRKEKNKYNDGEEKLKKLKEKLKSLL